MEYIINFESLQWFILFVLGVFIFWVILGWYIVTLIIKVTRQVWYYNNENK